jgi:hypothetical protein
MTRFELVTLCFRACKKKEKTKNPPSGFEPPIEAHRPDTKPHQNKDLFMMNLAGSHGFCNY